MKNKFKIFSLFLLFAIQFVAAQRTTVTVTTQVLPPYSTYLPDYLNSPSKVIFTLLSTDNARVRLKASIKGDNGISVTTSDSYRPATPLLLTAYQQKMMTGIDLKNYLDFNSVIVTGISKNDLFRGSGIPEGSYTLCIQALDYNTGEPLSNAEPLGCSNAFNIEQLSPPQLISPRCDETVMAGQIQNVIFSWLPPAGVLPGAQYKLKIVELNPSTRNPNEAMNSATTPAFFETTINSFSYVYGPAQPALKKDKKYAWRVTLLPAPAPGRAANQQTLNVQNKGNSEVCSFVYKNNVTVALDTPVTPGNYNINLLAPIKGDKINNGYGLEFWWSQSKKWVVKYQVQFTNSETQNKKITNWNVLPENLFSAKNAFYASKDVTYTNTKVKLPQSFTAQNGKMAWRVVAYDQANKAIDSSRIETYEVVTAPLTDRIKLISPIKGEKINNGYGLEFSWGASIKQVANYQVQFTDRENQNKKITNWNTVSDVVFTKKDAFYASKDAGAKLKLILPATFTTGNGKIAWRVVAFNNVKQAVDSSAVEVYEIVDAPLSDRIKLVSPIDGKKISGGENMKYEWTASKKKTIKEYIIQWKYIKDKKEVSEKLFSDTDFNGSIGPFKETSFSLTTQVDQEKRLMAWRVLGIANGKMVDSSLPDYVEFTEDTSELANLKSLMFNGYTIQINKIHSKDQDKFSASGKLLLWEGGKEVLCSFKDVKIRPIAYFPKIDKFQWAAIEGTMEINTKGMMPSNRIDLGTQKECEGVFQLALNSITMKAKLEGAPYEGKNLYKVTKDSGTTQGKVTLKWFSSWFIWEEGTSTTNKQYEFETGNEGTLAMSFANKFDGTVVLKSMSMKNLENAGIGVDFDSMGGIKVHVKKLEASTTLSGMIHVPNASPSGSDYNNFTKLDIPFKEQKNLNFKYTFASPMKWKINEEGSAWASVSETYVHLSDNGVIDSKFESYNNGLNFDKFGVEVTLPQKAGSTKKTPLLLTFDKVYNRGAGYTTNTKPGIETKNKGDIAGFMSKLKKSSFMINKNKLLHLNIEGDMYVPFVNDWAEVMINIDNKKIQEIYLSFDYDKKYYLANNQQGSYAYIKIWSGKLEGNSVVVSPSLTIKNNENKGLETESMSMCDLYIDASGAVSYNGNYADNSESTCEGSKKWATYYKFSYGIDKMKIKRNTIKNDAQFLFTGDVVLGDKISSTDKKEMGFLYHGIAPKPNMIDYDDVSNANPYQATKPNVNGIKSINGIKGPSVDVEGYSSSYLENSLEISDDGKAISGGYEDGAQKFGGGFKIKTNDPKWGNYFELGGYYEAKEPDAKELQAKMILGKKLENGGKYSYWFFEFKQKGFVSIPIIPGILEAHGFGGKAYYHIEPTYNNVGQITDMQPNKGYSLGIAAEADVRTAYDQGATIHGHVQIVTQFKGWSIDGISYYIKGDAIALNSDNPGLIQARLNGQLNWVDKYIDGKGQIWGKVHDVVCLNEGAANEDSIFFHFGADDFYMNVGTPENPITAEVMCGSGLSVGIWLGFDKKQMGFGFAQHYDSGWKGLNLGIASAEGRLISNFAAGVNVQYSPFQATGTASFDGRAYGKGCVDFWAFDGCIGGSCGVAANLTVSMPNPVVFQGSVTCDVHRWIPDFTLNAKWSSNGGFSIWL